jgi:1L-myo-inositol 1-phosphate cytidylyltransferase
VQGLIVAAGAGSRLHGVGGLKPLLPVAGRPIIEHVARASALAGLEGLVVVTGFEAERLERVLVAISRRCGLPIRIVRNDAWQPGNGTSVLAAAPLLEEPFALLMADHLFDPVILAELVEAGGRRRDADILLAIDRRLDNPLVDREDVTRAWCVGDRIVRLGKKLEVYNAYDCGLFWCTPALFSSLDSAIESGNAA